MSKLNKIFFGPAGTGKTRRAIEEAIKIVTKSSNVEMQVDKKKTDYENIIENFKLFRQLPKLPENIDNRIIEKIKSNSQSQDIVNQLAFNDIKKLVGNGSDREKAKKIIDEYRTFPLIEMVTFHPSYSYQDFVEGITVETNDNNEIQYKVQDGIFKKICNRAIDYKENSYVLIIDEINRGDIASIFGELFTLLEDNKRVGNKESLSINLPYSKDKKTGNPKTLTVPNNLYLLATMNTVDKSIALIDVALRRRFDFIECMPKYNKELIELKPLNGIDLSKLLETMNKRITILKNEHYQIGHSYFLNLKNINELQDVIIKKIIPLLQEYFYDDWKSICAVLNQSYKNPNNNGLLISEKYDKKLFSTEFDELFNYVDRTIFTINHNFSKEDIIKVYEQL